MSGMMTSTALQLSSSPHLCLLSGCHIPPLHRQPPQASCLLRGSAPVAAHAGLRGCGCALVALTFKSGC